MRDFTLGEDLVQIPIPKLMDPAYAPLIATGIPYVGDEVPISSMSVPRSTAQKMSPDFLQRSLALQQAWNQQSRRSPTPWSGGIQSLLSNKTVLIVGAIALGFVAFNFLGKGKKR